MEEIKNTSDLKSAIAALEKRSKEKKEVLIEKFEETYESLKPRNILYNAVNNITGSSKLTNTIITTAGSLITGLATTLIPKKFLFRFSSSIVRKIGGIVFDTGIKSYINQYVQQIKGSGTNLFKRLFNKFIH